MPDSLLSLSSPRIYLLGMFLMAVRTFWKTRSIRCEHGELVKPYSVMVNDQTYDLRYVLMITLSALWPIAVLVMLLSRLVSLFSSADDDDAEST